MGLSGFDVDIGMTFIWYVREKQKETVFPWMFIFHLENSYVWFSFSS